MLDGVQRYPLSSMFPVVSVKAVFCLHYFFNLYMDRLSVILSKTKVGCVLGKIIVNHLAYADDLVILSPSAKGLQQLLNICSEYGEEHDIMFNHKGTQGFLKFAPFAMGH